MQDFSKLLPASRCDLPLTDQVQAAKEWLWNTISDTDRQVAVMGANSPIKDVDIICSVQWFYCTSARKKKNVPPITDSQPTQ